MKDQGMQSGRAQLLPNSEPQARVTGLFARFPPETKCCAERVAGAWPHHGIYVQTGSAKERLRVATIGFDSLDQCRGYGGEYRRLEEHEASLFFFFDGPSAEHTCRNPSNARLGGACSSHRPPAARRSDRVRCVYPPACRESSGGRLRYNAPVPPDASALAGAPWNERPPRSTC